MTNGRFALPLSDGRFYDSLRHKVVGGEALDGLALTAGREEEAIRSVLLSRDTTGIDVIPSWECNLRCPHCYVGKHLRKPSGSTTGDVDPAKLTAFTNKLRTMTEVTRLYFVGGEPFLHPDLIRRVDVPVPLHVTTNGYWDYDALRDVLARLEMVTFSIDGLPEDHNRIRKTLDRHPDPFGVTYRNMHRTIKDFPACDVQVQGSMVDREYTSDEKLRFAALMVMAGVKATKIHLGPAASTDRHDGGANFKEKAGRVLRNKPCCDYKSGFHLIVLGNAIYHSYYQIGEVAPIGTLDDDPEAVLRAYDDRVLAGTPILKDKVCMTQCRAVGVCWGGCSNTRHEFAFGLPSTVCDRTYKEGQVDALAQGAVMEVDWCHP